MTEVFRTLGIESSCDDTCIAVVENGTTVLSSVVSSQIPVHSEYGGVVPELASREHVKNIRTVYRETMKTASVGLSDIDLIGVTVGPGLLGSLLVGLSFAKALSFSSGIPLIPLNHIESHIQSAFIEFGSAIHFPAAAFVASGGHTHLFRIDESRNLILLARTRDDAVGEAFDKLSKMMGLGYPGGPVIDKLAETGDENRYSLPRPRMSDRSLDMSFSGIKTAMFRLIREEGDALDKSGLAASFQKTVADILIDRIKRFGKEAPFESVILAGGVSANSYLRERFRTAFGEHAFIPSMKYATDNGAMVASLAWMKRKEEPAPLHQEAFSTWILPS